MEIEFNNEKEKKRELETIYKESLVKGKNKVNNVKKEIIKRDEQMKMLRKKFMVVTQEVNI